MFSLTKNRGVIRPAGDLASRPAFARGLRIAALIAACAAIVLGVFVRLEPLGSRVLFTDEAFTQLRVSGHSSSDMWASVYDGKPRSARRLLAFASVGPASTPAKLIASLELEDAQHPPLFYLIDWATVRAAGDSLTVWRLPAALFGIAAIGAAAWLAWTLYGRGLPPVMAAGLFALSPIERVYSQQAREYSLVALATLVLTTLAVRASRRPTVARWGAYALVAAAGLYASPFLAYVVAAHAAFIAVTTGPERRRVTVGFALAVAAALVMYAPWIAQLAEHREQIAATNAWSAQTWPVSRVAAKWAFNLGSTVFDLEYVNLRWTLGAAAGLGLLVFAVVQGLRATTNEARWLLATLILVPALALVVPDLMLGEHRSAVTRYGLPVCTALIVAASLGMARRPALGIGLLTLGLAATVVGAGHNAWWDNDSNADDPTIAAIVNAVPGAQVAAALVPPMAISLARDLRPDVPVSLRAGLSGAQFASDRPLFVVRPTAVELAAFAAQTHLRFRDVPFVAVRTAHDVGAGIGQGGSGTEGSTKIYRADRGMAADTLPGTTGPAISGHRLDTDGRSSAGSLRPAG